MKFKTIIIPSAGKGSRFNNIYNLPKCLIEINQKTILDFIINFWLVKKVEEFIVVTSKQYFEVEKILNSYNLKYKILIQKHPTGIADAILCAEEEVKDNFIVHLGDCLSFGKFKSKFDIGIGVLKNSNEYLIKSNYGVLERRGRVIKVEEKPQKVDNYYCGMGIYFFGTDIFNIIKATPYHHKEKEITDVLESCIKSGYELKPIFFEGEYFNINTGYDLECVRKYFHKICNMRWSPSMDYQRRMTII